jgi:hypothetical protein
MGEPERFNSNHTLLNHLHKNRIEWNNKKDCICTPYHGHTSSSRDNILMLPKLEYQEYMNEITKYKFVTCKFGNGLDTHRFSEILLMGSVPVINHSGLDDLYSQFPCIYEGDDITTFRWDEQKYQSFLNMFWLKDTFVIDYLDIKPQTPKPRFFNMDLHISVIEDFKNLFPKFDITHWCLSGHAWVTNQKTIVPEHINQKTWMNIDERLIKNFQDRYDSLLTTFDGFICAHPNTFAMIFEKYNKPIIMINSCRYDLPICLSKNMDMLQKYNDCLTRLHAKNLLIAVSNNKADQLYTKIGCNIDTTHIPSLCAYTNMRYAPTKDTFLCYNGDFEHRLVTKKSTLGGRYKWEDLCKFKGIIHFPYEVSTMSMFEQFTARIPLFFPSKKYMLENISIQSVGSYWAEKLPERLQRFSDKSIWIENADFYQVFQSPNVYLFDSIPHLITILETFQWKDDSSVIEAYKNNIKNKWKSLLYNFN